MMRLLSSILLILLFFFSSSSSLVSSCDEGDTQTLLRIKQAFGNPESLSSWDPAVDCCSGWNGVLCRANGDADETDRVMRIIFSGDNLSGPIPPMFGDLPMLIEIFFLDIPNLSGPIPATLSNLTRLESLTISNTRVSGPIPSFLCSMPALVNVDLSGNRHTGSIPDCFGRHDYDYLALSRNRLTGVIPPALGNSDFWEIDLSRNRLVGDAAFLFGEKKRADMIDLSGNQLDFDLSDVGFPLRLNRLNISHNRIRGTIPSQASKMGLIREFDVSYNELCGPIPTAGFMKQFNQSSYAHNKCLCGGPLPRCRRTTTTTIR